MDAKQVVGVDVSKVVLDVAGLGEMPEQCPNEPEAIETLIKRLQAMGAVLVVMEASGGYETPATSAMIAAGLRVAVVNPRQVRDFARATGWWAKTDCIDAEVLVEFGRAIDPQITRLPDEQSRELQALLARRTQLIGMRVQESNRLGLSQSGMRKQIKAHIAWLDEAIAQLNIDIRFYQQLTQRGKPHKVAVVACMRKIVSILNAMARTNTPWNPNLHNA